MQITGTIYKIEDKVQLTETFSKREFIVEVPDENPEYSQMLKLEVINDLCETLDEHRPGNIVEVQINVRGRKWVSPENKEVFFNTLQAWRISQVDRGAEADPQPEDYIEDIEPENDPLPF